MINSKVFFYVGLIGACAAALSLLAYYFGYPVPNVDFFSEVFAFLPCDSSTGLVCETPIVRDSFWLYSFFVSSLVSISSFVHYATHKTY